MDKGLNIGPIDGKSRGFLNKGVEEKKIKRPGRAVTRGGSYPYMNSEDWMIRSSGSSIIRVGAWQTIKLIKAHRTITETENMILV
jgi:hypothetical protein